MHVAQSTEVDIDEDSVHLKRNALLIILILCTVHLLLFCTMTKKMHNYLTNYHTPTCFDTIMSSSENL